MPRRSGMWACVVPVLFIQACIVDKAFAQEPSGRAVGVIPDASALRSQGRQVLAVQHPVYMGDRIQTGQSGEAQINFVDSTRLVVGPASSLLIDSSVLRNRKTMSSFVVSALRGTFRFISGNSPKPAYAIRTPTATIGVRGTEFDFAVLPDGGTDVVLFQGQARVCDRSGSCVLLEGACAALTVPMNGPMQPLTDRNTRNARLRNYFPYVQARNAGLRPEFRTNIRTCGNIASAPAEQEPGDRNRASSPARAAAGPTPAPPAAPPSRPDPAPRARPGSPAPPEPAPPAPPQATPAAQPTMPSPASPPKAEPTNPPSKGGHKDHHGHGHSKGDRGGEHDKAGRARDHDGGWGGGRGGREGGRNSDGGKSRR